MYILKYVFKYACLAGRQVFLFFVFLLLFYAPVSAAPIWTLTPSKTAIDENESFNVTIGLTVGGSEGNIYYLKGSFFHPESTGSGKYFGYTKNNDNLWYKGGSGHTTYFKIGPMNEFNSWAGQVEFKPDTESSSYKEAEVYNFVVGYYTESGSGPTWSDPVQITIVASNEPTPTPSPSPVSSPTPSPSSNPTPTPSPSPSPKVFPSPKPSPKPSPSPSIIPSPSPSPSPQEEMVLGVQESSPSAAPEGGETLLAGFVSRKTLLPVGLVGMGLLLLVFSVYSLLKKSSSVRISEENDNS